MHSFKNMKWTTLFFILTGLESLACLVFLFLIAPPEKENFILGYSIGRWLMASGFAGLFFGFGFLAFISTKKKTNLNWFESFFLSPAAFWIAVFLLLVLLLLTVMIPFNESVSQYFARLLPLLVWGIGFFLEILIFQIGLTKGELARKAWISFKHFYSSIIHEFSQGLNVIYLFFVRSTPRILGLVLLISVPILFQAAFRFNMPLGYAGLYTLMSDTLANNHFILPQSVAYYGPGGIPFAYPPLAFYVMGFLTQVLGIPVLGYLQFAPPFFSWLGLVPAFFLTFELTRSRVAAVASTMIIASSGYLFLVHSEADGSVRSLAFLFSLWGLLFFYRLVRHPDWKNGLLSSLFFGLTILTHLSYVLFVVFGIVAYILAYSLQARLWILGLIVGVSGGVIASPWWLTIISRYGIQIFVDLFRSHGNDYYPVVFSNFNNLILWIDNGLNVFRNYDIFFGLVVIALVYLLIIKKFYLPLWFGLMIIFISEGSRFTFFVGAIMIGFFLSQIYLFLARPQLPENLNRAVIFRGHTFVLLLLIMFCAAGNNVISTYKPSLPKESLLVADFFKKETDLHSTYLLVAQPEESEWFPYLLQRTPLVASWGGEWTGTYVAQLSYVLRIGQCEKAQSISCLDDVIAEVRLQPDYLITHTQNNLLTAQIVNSGNWQEVYQDGTYLVWRNRKISSHIPFNPVVLSVTNE